jgi:hypothetical protein
MPMTHRLPYFQKSLLALDVVAKILVAKLLSSAFIICFVSAFCVHPAVSVKFKRVEVRTLQISVF